MTELLDAVTCADCGGASGDISLVTCPGDGAVLGEVRMTVAELGERAPLARDETEAGR